MVKSNSISVLVHIFYSDGFAELLPELKNLGKITNQFYFNLCSSNENQETISAILSFFPGSIIIQTPNKGKDIGAKLALIDLQIRLNDNSDFSIFLHDKRSPHTSTGKVWREKLLKIVQPDHTHQIINIFETKKSVGLISAKEFITSEYDEGKKTFRCTSNSQLKTLIEKFGFQSRKFEFVGGTMFWVRTKIYNDFFSAVSPLQMRATLEEGNIMDFAQGSQTHAWERILSWIVLNKGFTIKGI